MNRDYKLGFHAGVSLVRGRIQYRIDCDPDEMAYRELVDLLAELDTLLATGPLISLAKPAI